MHGAGLGVAIFPTDNSLSGSTVHRENRTTTSKKEGVNVMLTSGVGLVKLICWTGAGRLGTHQ
jgi:hypothetical protein